MISELRAGFDYEIRVADIAQFVGVGYTPKLHIGGSSSLSVSGTIDAEDVIFTLTAAQTAALATGQYWYQITAEVGLLRTFIADGLLWVVAKVTGTGTYDGRSTAEKILEAIDNTILGKATADQQSYVIQSGAGSRSLSRMDMAQLLEAKKHYAQIVSAEYRARNEAPLFKRHTFSFIEP